MTGKTRPCAVTWPGQSEAPISRPHPEHQCARPLALSPITGEWWHPGLCICWCGGIQPAAGPQPLGIPAAVLTDVVETNARLLREGGGGKGEPVRSATLPAPSGLQLDLLTAIARLEQIEREDPPDHFVWYRVVTCDIPRLRGYLTGETLAWEAQVQ